MIISQFTIAYAAGLASSLIYSVMRDRMYSKSVSQVCSLAPLAIALGVCAAFGWM